MAYTIKEVSERTGMNSYVLRYYEKEGLLPHIRRGRGGIRSYTDADLELLGLIGCLKRTGMSLRDIRTFVQLQEAGPETLRQRCEILEAQQRSIRHSIDEMQKNSAKVAHKLEVYRGLLREYEQRKD